MTVRLWPFLAVGMVSIWAAASSAQSTLSGPLPYDLPSCTAKDAGSVSVSNVVVLGTCTSPLDTVDVQFNYSFFANSDSYDLRFALTTLDGGGLRKVFQQTCLNTAVGATVEDPPVSGGISPFDNIDGDGDCADVFGKAPGTSGTVSFSMSCDPLNTGRIDPNLTVAPALDWTQRVGLNKGWQFEAPKCKLGDGAGLGEFSIQTAAVIQTISKVSTGGTGSFVYSLSNASANNLAGGTGSTIVTTTAGVPATDGVDYLVQDLSQPVVLSEVAQPGWEVSDIVCQSGGGSVGSFDAATGALTIPGGALTKGDELSCTITNDPVAPPVFTASITKVTDVFMVSSVGENIPYRFEVRNTGNQPLVDLRVTDSLDPGYLCQIPLLPPGATDAGCTFDYTVTQSDLDQGGVSNIVTLQGPQIPETTASLTVDAVRTPSLSLDKALNPTKLTYAAVGDRLTFDFMVTNSGNVTLEGPVTVNDSRIAVPVVCQASGLQPGAGAMCSAELLVTQDDLDNGTLVNSATAQAIFNSSPVISSPDTATAVAQIAPALTTEKTFAGTDNPGFFALGDLLDFGITVTNTGNVTLTGPVTVTDNLGAATCPPPVASLTPGASVICTYQHQVTTADISLGSVTNVASATAFYGGTQVVSPADDAIYPVDAAPAISLAKTVVTPGFDATGQGLTFRFAVTNTGNVDLLEDILISDNLISATPFLCRDVGLGPFAPGATHSCDVSYSVTQVDLDTGQVANNATAQSGFNATPLTSPNASAVVAGTVAPDLSLIKVQTSGPVPATAGDTLGYQITASNTGNQTLRAVAVNDPLIPGLTCTVGGVAAPGPVTLAPGAALVCEGSYQVIQADMDAGSLTNTASAQAVIPTGAPLLRQASATQALAPAAPALQITKALRPDPGAAPAFQVLGQVLTFVAQVENTGTVTLQDITVTDGLPVTPATCLIPLLAPGATNSGCAFAYTVAQADLDRVQSLPGGSFGGFTNLITAQATPVRGAGPVVASDDLFVLGPAQAPAMTLTKTADLAQVATLGQVITYSYALQNTGNITLTAVPQIVDDKIGNFACADWPAGGVAPGNSHVCTATYRVTQADLNAGSITNLASVTSAQVSTPALDSAGVAVDQSPMLQLTKTPSIAADAQVGDVISFTYRVENTGNQTLEAVTVTDQQTSASGTVALSVAGDDLAQDAGPAGDSQDAVADGIWDSLAPGDVAGFAASYTVTQADIDAGLALSNTATVRALGPAATPLPEESVTVTVPVTVPQGSIAVIKSFDAIPLSSPPVAGEEVVFTITARNTGNVTLTAPILTDSLRRVDTTPLNFDSGPALTGGAGSFEVGETWQWTARYTLTQADVDAGGIVNIARVAAQTPTGGTVEGLSDDGNPGNGVATPTTVVIPAAPGIEGIKRLTQMGQAPGDTVMYEITLQNTGNVTMTSVGVRSDTLTRSDGTLLDLTSGPVFVSSTQGSGAGVLRPGESAVYRASYRLTQADIDAGGLNNRALVAGQPPTGAEVTDQTDNGNDSDGNTQDDATPLALTQTPAIALEKRLAPNSPLVATEAGQSLTFAFELTNTGNVTLTGTPDITDALITGQGGAVTCPSGPLAPGASLTCTAAYTVTQADLDAGTVQNTATAQFGAAPSTTDSVTVPVQSRPGVLVVKEAASITQAAFVPGAEAVYTYTVTNTGNTTLPGPIVVTDNLIPDVVCPAGALAPGDSRQCTGRYTVTAQDVFLGSVTNLASARIGGTQSPLVSETIPDAGIPQLSLTKTSSEAGFDAVGTVLGYTFTVTNSGTRSFVSDITVEDDRLGTVLCFAASEARPALLPGDSVTCSATDTVRQADLDAGDVTNQAFARTLIGAGAEVVSDPATVIVPALSRPALSVTKTSTSGPVTGVGDVIDYAITVTNSGTVTLSNVQADDPLLPGLGCVFERLAPGDRRDCQDSYSVTQADLDRGQVDNTVIATALTPGFEAVTAQASHSQPMPTPQSRLTLTKHAAPDPFGPVGTTLTYLFDVANTGTVTLTNVQVTDPFSPGFDCVIPRLRPGQTDLSCAFDTVITQNQIDAGSIANTATASGTDPFGSTVTAQASIVTQGPAQVVELDATNTLTPVPPVVGGVLLYTLTIENKGTVTLIPTGINTTVTRLDGTVRALDGPYILITGDTDRDNQIDPDETWVQLGTYTLTQDDIDAGGLDSSVEVVATGGGQEVRDISDNGIDSDGNTQDDATRYSVPTQPALLVTKTIEQGGTQPGDTVLFRIAARNIGNQPLFNLQVTDTLRRANGQILPGIVPTAVSAPATLVPGETAIWELAHVMTQADVDAGGLSNSAIVSGETATGDRISDISSDDDVTDGDLDNDPTYLALVPAASLEVIKILTNLGQAVGDEAAFEITLRNTGSVSLNTVTITDIMTNATGDSIGPVTLAFDGASLGSAPEKLLPGETATYRARYALTQADIESGGVINVALGTATTPLGGLVMDRSDDDGFGTGDPTVGDIGGVARLTVDKSVGRQDFVFPTVTRTQFDIAVTNDGTVTQTGIDLRDDLGAFLTPAELLSDTYPIEVRQTGFDGATTNPGYDGVADTRLLAGTPSLAPGDTGVVSLVVTYRGTPGAANNATVTSQQLGVPTEGEVAPVLLDGDGDGIPDLIEGTGDRDGDGVPDDQDYDPSGYFYCEDDGRILSGGQISVTGEGFSQTGIGTSGPITIVRDGRQGAYQFHVTAPGTYSLGLVYPDLGQPSDQRLSGGGLTASTLRPSNPGVIGAGEQGSTGRLTDQSAAANPFYTSFVFQAGDPALINNNIPLTACLGQTDVTATKSVDRSTAVFGETLTYTLRFSNTSGRGFDVGRIVDLLPGGVRYTPGSARIDGVAAAPVIDGQRLIWTHDLGAGDSTTVVFQARVAARDFGGLINRAWFQDATGSRLSNEATAEVQITPEAVFDCTDIIGKVFDDKNRNGYQDGPDTLRGISDQSIFDDKLTARTPENTTEPGLAGVRVVTPDGTLITTDAFGRYSVPCAALPQQGTGSNFVIKLDTRTLPSGYGVTTENPLMLRVTPGKLTKFNFGAVLADVITLDLTAAAFEGETPSAALTQAMRGLVRDIAMTPTAIDLRYLRGSGESVEQANARLRVFEQQLRQMWRGQGRYDLDLTPTILSGGN